jgi:PAS domain S-box-containing protein
VSSLLTSEPQAESPLTPLFADALGADQALRTTEARYRTLADAAPDAIYIVNERHEVVYANAVGLERFGRQAGDLLGRPTLSQLFPAAIAAQMWRELAQVFDTNTRHRFETRFDTPRGDLWLETWLVPMPDRDVDGSRQVMGVSRDIGDRKLLEREFVQAQKMEAIGRLAGGIAHDFNNLLTAILGYADLLMDRIGDNPLLAADLEEVRKAGTRATSLTRQLLAFSRRQPSEPRPLDLNAIVADLLRMLDRVIGEDVRIHVTFENDAAPINADPTQIEQMIMNIAVNARDAMPKGGRLTIRTATSTVTDAVAHRHGGVGGTYVSLAMSDTGCGISPEVLEHIFEPFFTTKSEGKGTGLGMAIVFAVVRECGGFITVDSTPGSGTTITVYLPATAALGASPTRLPDAPAESGTETILVVEDEPAIRTLVKRTLEKRGYRVLVADSSVTAPALVESYPGRIDLLLSDVVMPDVSGPDVAQHIVQIRPEIRVLYISGFSNFSNKVSQGLALANGRTAFLPKPFTSQALAAKVRECLSVRLIARR